MGSHGGESEGKNEPDGRRNLPLNFDAFDEVEENPIRRNKLRTPRSWHMQYRALSKKNADEVQMFPDITVAAIRLRCVPNNPAFPNSDSR